MATNAAEDGVDVRTGLRPGLRTLARTVGGADELRQLSLIDMKVREEIAEAGITLPQGVSGVFVEERTGEPAYYRVERDEEDNPYLVPTLINPPGMDRGDLIAGTPLGLQIAAETFGSLLGASLAATRGGLGMTTAAAVGSGTMAAATNMTRQAIARHYGVPEDMVAKIMNDEMLQDVLFAAGGDVLAGTGMGIYRGITNHWFRPLRADTDIRAIQQGFQDATAKVQTLEELVDSPLFLSLGMATDDVQLLALEKQVKMHLRDKFARTQVEKDISNEMTMGQAVRRINEKRWPTAGNNYHPTEVGRRTQDVVQEPGRRAGERVAAAEESLARAGRALPEPSPDVWIDTQTLRRFAGEQFEEAERVAWSTFRGPRGISVDPDTGAADIWLRNAPNSPVRKYLRDLGREADQTLARTFREAQEKLLRDMNIDPATNKALDAAVPSLADEALDYRQVHILISHLKSNSHKMESAIPGWSKQEVDGLIQAFERQIHVSPAVYGYPSLANQRQTPEALARMRVDPERQREVRNLWDQAKHATSQKYDFQNLEALTEVARTRRVPGMPGDAAGPRAQEFVHQADMVRGVFLRPNNSDALAELRHLQGFSPDLTAKLQRELLGEYHRAAFIDGKFSRVASDNFLKQYDGHIRVLWGEGNVPTITNIQNLSDAVIRTERRAEQVHLAARQIFGKQVNMADPPQEVARELLTGRYTPTQLQQFATRIQRTDPVLWNDIQQQGLRWIEQQTGAGAAGQALNYNALNRLVTGDTGRKLGALYGQEYVENMTVLRDVYGMMAREKLGQGWATSIQTPLLQVSRSLLGPLSKKQRFITAMNRAMKSLGNRSFREAMNNPDYLKAWVEVQKASPGSYAAAHAAMRLPHGLFMAIDDETRRQAAVIRHFQRGGTEEQLSRMRPEDLDIYDDGDDDDF